MSKTRVMTIVGIIGIAAIVAISLPLTFAKAETGHEHHGQMDKMDMKKGMKKHVKAGVLTLEKIHSGHLPMVLESIEKAIKAIEADDNDAALTELHKAKKMLTSINESIGKHIKPKFANSQCPMWGAPIEPDKVTEDLIREYKGQKVAFCCKECPPEWDKLMDAEKDDKLSKAKSEPTKTHSEHNVHGQAEGHMMD